jgi:hypothetical protein
VLEIRGLRLEISLKKNVILKQGIRTFKRPHLNDMSLERLISRLDASVDAYLELVVGVFTAPLLRHAIAV